MLPALPVLWGHPGTSTLRERYRELLISCPPSHAKLTGGGWHARPLRVADVREMPASPVSFDEVHWCARAAPTHQEYHRLWVVLRPGGLLQVQAHARPPHPPAADSAASSASADAYERSYGGFERVALPPDQSCAAPSPGVRSHQSCAASSPPRQPSEDDAVSAAQGVYGAYQRLPR